MLHVVYVAPWFSGNTHRVLAALLSLEGVAVSLVTCERPDRVPGRARLRAVQQVGNVLDPQVVADACRALARAHGPVDRLLGFLEQMQLPLAQVRDLLGIEGMGAEAARNFRDKNRMKQVLRDAGVPVARQALIRSGDDARRFVSEVGYPVVLKPLAGLGSKGTSRVTRDEELYAALNQLLPSEHDPVQAEEFVQGEEHTFETVCIDGEPVWHSSTYYLPGPLQVLENPWVQYCVLLPRERSAPHVEAFRETNRQALAALGMQTGMSHMEWFLRSDGSAVVSEVGARPPGVHIMPMLGYAHDVDVWAKWVRLMVHGTFTMPERAYACGVAFLRGQGRGRVVRAVHGVADAQARVEGLVQEFQLPRVGQPAASGYEGEGYVIVRHPETARVVEALRDLVSRIRIELG